MHQHSNTCVDHSTSVVSLPQPTNKVKLLVIALLLIGGFALVELAVGWFSHSLALLADAGHMASDSFALVLALLATWIGRRRKLNNITPGNHPLELVAALSNGIILVIIALWISWEAMERLQSPSVEIFSLPMLATATVGLGVNSVNILLLHQDSHHDLNIRGAFLHVLADATSSMGVILAAIAIWSLGWTWADGVISLFVAGLIIISAVPLIIQTIQALTAKSVAD